MKDSEGHQEGAAKARLAARAPEHTGDHRRRQGVRAQVGALGVLRVPGRRGHSHRSLHRARLRQGRARPSSGPAPGSLPAARRTFPQIGDYQVYDIGPYSFIITRVGAERHSCLLQCLPASRHEAARLRHRGRASEFQCSFHGWSWNIDGTNKNIVCPWDFPHVDRKKLALPEARGGSCSAASCSSTWTRLRPRWPNISGPEFKAHIDAWKLEDRYVYLHVAKRLPCNWKLAIEAFLEAYHVIRTHPQVAVSNADANSQYDVYGEHVESLHLDRWAC